MKMRKRGRYFALDGKLQDGTVLEAYLRLVDSCSKTPQAIKIINNNMHMEVKSEKIL